MQMVCVSAHIACIPKRCCMHFKRQSAILSTASQAPLLCRFYPGMDRLASADVHGHVLVHLIHDSGDEILMNQCLSLNLGKLHGAHPTPHYKALDGRATMLDQYHLWLALVYKNMSCSSP